MLVQDDHAGTVSGGHDITGDGGVEQPSAEGFSDGRMPGSEEA
ncbi:MAG: hypothetical protein ACRD2W_11665 [Acidimicrobiales bacterium]